MSSNKLSFKNKMRRDIPVCGPKDPTEPPPEPPPPPPPPPTPNENPCGRNLIVTWRFSLLGFGDQTETPFRPLIANADLSYTLIGTTSADWDYSVRVTMPNGQFTFEIEAHANDGSNSCTGHWPPATYIHPCEPYIVEAEGLVTYTIPPIHLPICLVRIRDWPA